MTHRFDNITGAGFALRADHGRTLADAPQSLAQVACAAYKRHTEKVFVDMEMLVSRRQHLGFIDAIHADGLQNLGFYEMSNTTLRHHRNSHSLFNLNNQFGIAHTRHAALRANISWHPLQRHHCRRSRVLRDTRLLSVDNVANHAAPEHFWKISLNLYGSCLLLHDQLSPTNEVKCSHPCSHFTIFDRRYHHPSAHPHTSQ